MVDVLALMAIGVKASRLMYPHWCIGVFYHCILITKDRSPVELSMGVFVSEIGGITEELKDRSRTRSPEVCQDAD